MPLNLVDEVSVDFIAKNPDADKAAIASFGQFFKDWLAQKKVIGVGQTVDGFSVRFADSTEAILYGEAADVLDNFAVSISGSVGRSDRTVVDNSSFNITGK
jgi:hypothetical protein